MSVLGARSGRQFFPGDSLVLPQIVPGSCTILRVSFQRIEGLNHPPPVNTMQERWGSCKADNAKRIAVVDGLISGLEATRQRITIQVCAQYREM